MLTSVRNRTVNRNEKLSSKRNGIASYLPISKYDLHKKGNLVKSKRSAAKLLFGFVFLLWSLNAALVQLHSLDKDMKKYVRMGASRFWVILEEWQIYEPIRGFMTDYTEHGYPQLKVLEDNYSIIREEASNLKHIREHLRPLSEVLKAGGIHKTSWATFFLQVGQGPTGTIEENAKYTPRTSELLKNIPGVYNAFFSILDGNTHLPPHWGYYKGFVRYHLGVDIPLNNENEKNWIKVNPDYPFNKEHEAAVTLGDTSMIDNQPKYFWKNGEGVIFDDGYIHEANNEGSEPRIVLFLDVERSMPWYASIVNKIMLLVSMNDKSIKEMRKNAVIQLDKSEAVAK